MLRPRPMFYRIKGLNSFCLVVYSHQLKQAIGQSVINKPKRESVRPLLSDGPTFRSAVVKVTAGLVLRHISDLRRRTEPTGTDRNRALITAS